MPSAPRKVCRKPGCGKLVENGAYCGQHQIQKEVQQKAQVKKYDNERGTAASRGYSSRWTRYSKKYREENPLCVRCKEKGILKLGGHVDHIVPVKDKDDPLFWETSNHQTLCVSCHSEKTAKEDGGFGNPRIRSF